MRLWIENGAKWGTEKIDPFRYSTDSRAGIDWWSLQPLRNTQPPTMVRPGWTANPIDAFVDSKRSEAGLEPSAQADKRTLIRRLTFDLLGLPPKPEEINTFLSDTSDHAYENLVDRLLASPHYGERWARHWLDIVRFGESNGFEYDQPRDNAYPYRNWVINALNQDMPYDEFVRMQLAGDILLPNDFDTAAATGFLRRREVDIIVSNQSHPGWIRGFAENGYLVLPDRRLFVASPELRRMFEPFADTARGLHLTNMDGHGPHSL